MTQPPRIYLDNAATSWPKPESVYAAVDRYQRAGGAAAGRGGYWEGNESDRLLADARRRLAACLNADDPRRIVFTFNGTDSLNLALHGLLRPGDHVISSVAEHNSVLRPLRYLEQHREVQVTLVSCDGQGFVDPDQIRAAIRPQTRLIALVHASNVTGAIQPAEEVGRLAAEYGLRFLLDAAQSVGHLPLDVQQVGAHLVAAPGHKGLLGPLGVGFLYVAPGLEQELQPLRQGGTGTQSESDEQPASMPDRFEAGNHNLPGIAGLGAGLAYLAERGLDAVRRHDRQLLERLVQGLSELPGIQVHGPRDLDRRVGVVSITVAGADPQELGLLLDSGYRIQVRAGLHCAPRMHRALGTADRGGTLRFSLGPFNTLQHVDAALQALAEITSTTLTA
jgi:cysteine desulfurase family protein